MADAPPLAFSIHYTIISAHSPGNVNRLDPVLTVPEYVARSISPVFSRMGIRVVLLTITTACDFERGGATNPIIGSS